MYLEVRDVIAPQATDVAGSEALQDSLHLTGNRAEGQWRAPCSEVELLAGRVHLGQLSIAAHCCPQDKQVGVVGVVGGAVELWPSRALSGGTLTHRCYRREPEPGVEEKQGRVCGSQTLRPWVAIRRNDHDVNYTRGDRQYGCELALGWASPRIIVPQ